MNFFKTSLLNGLYALLPIMLLWMGLKEIGGLLAVMAEPIADMFPSEYFDDLKWPGIVATILIVATSLILGILALIPHVVTLAEKFETTVLYRVPMYRMLKLISSSLVRADASHVAAALLSDGEGGGEPCYVMEFHDNGLATILLPWSPASFAGSIRIVPRSRLEILSCSIDEYSRSISFMGVGLEECIAQKAPENRT